MYVTRRRNRVLRKTNPPPLDPAKSNPSKRHRERLNGELEYLARLLPFDDGVIAKLDKLSILRLAVSYIRAKSHYEVVSPIPTAYIQCNGETQLKALNGFAIIIDPNSEVFYVSESVEQYLGFHQSDILHQCVLELVHSEDRDSMSQHLNWSNLLMHLGPNPTVVDTDRLQAIGGESHKLLQRSFIVRFRCLLDNTSGFITMEINGHLKPLYRQVGLNGLSLFAVCTPFGPAPLADSETEDMSFRCKLRLDMTLTNLDSRGEQLLGDVESTTMYNLLHPLDLQYFSDAHKEMVKAGSCGLVAYRILNRDRGWLWLQTSARVVYKNNKPDYIMCFHRILTEEEGSNLLSKRDIGFTMPHLHVGTMIDDGEYVEELNRTPKTRKPRKPQTNQITESNSASYEALTQVASDKDSHVYYPFQGFPPTFHQYSTPCSAQLHDSYGLVMDSVHPRYISQATPMDYLTYPNHLQMAIGADRLAAVARIQQPTTATNPYTHPYYSLGTTEHTTPHCSAIPNTPSRYCLQGYPSASGIFGTDVNANALQSFRDMTYPLLNQ